MKSLVSSEIVEPYAQALMSVAKTHNLADRFGDEVRALVSALEGSADLSQFLANPFIKVADKKAVLQRIVGDESHPFLRNFLMLLVDKGRILFIEGIGKQYLALLRELNQTVLAEVVSAVELNDAQKESVKQRVQNITGARSVDLQTTIDPDLIGGVIIKVGSQIIDASLRGQLRRIGVRLAA
ncbi:ATP synthase F1 subunit delta [Ancylothrix sp. C2]|uniref:ATP synthase F1 subunit delta n=1 Tax=Ancylothrix sp. D3o TaxID=2953691 RepID=UPI0021BAD288|nr:ATP synthase F1 subunit delta [Ancylothrix sp. D3o]MCT7949437.1 ATP synthase F1 subunit delta [Ancylothrix sp. D3o]